MWLNAQFGSFKEQTCYAVGFTYQMPVQLSAIPRPCVIWYEDKNKKIEDFNRNRRDFFSANILIRNMSYFLYSILLMIDFRL